ncbi:hypothetical protein FB451DRAFT_626275 [Mycena latifolia]|nr:hypothetical protein FB451DRAFT_626275 [Mycena latifolia]
MVLTRRASKAIARWLPTEIMTEIVQASPPSDQASLCRVSKLFNGLGRPVLYRVVDLQSYAPTAAFCAAVLSNTALAELVRSYTVTAVFRGDIETRLSRQLVDSAKALLRLQSLSIDIALLEDRHLQELLRWTFPHLVQCGLGTRERRWSSAERGDTLFSFLLRHPALTSLHIKASVELEVWPSTSTRTPLPHLQRLRCPARVVQSVAASGLVEARLYWEEYEHERVDVESTFLALKSLTRADVPFICSNDYFRSGYGFTEIVDSISRNMPQTKTLHLRLYELQSCVNTINKLAECLPRFTALEFLALHGPLFFRYNGPDNNEQQQIIVRKNWVMRARHYRDGA